MGLEIIEQVPNVEAIVVPVGGGGLIAGTALAVKSLRPNVKIIVSISTVTYLFVYDMYSIGVHRLYINIIDLWPTNARTPAI